MHCVINPPCTPPPPPSTHSCRRERRRVEMCAKSQGCLKKKNWRGRKNHARTLKAPDEWVFLSVFSRNCSVQVPANTVEFIGGISQNSPFPQRGLKVKKSFQAHRHHPKHPAAWPLFFVLGFVTASPVMACNSRLLLGVSTFLCLYSVCLCVCVPYLHHQSPVT